ncbi:hypothetical protein A4A49_21342 [Nicotiana attenuata]|uniref:Uncharacterized protein n=1 Tax=Nicotiana attenuata TaxID=49451 RepID=A0A1J6L8Q7_NICAT|nr:hypothetical protein A4A49_21342 [Nicotiana attenuata]
MQVCRQQQTLNLQPGNHKTVAIVNLMTVANASVDRAIGKGLELTEDKGVKSHVVGQGSDVIKPLNTTVVSRHATVLVDVADVSPTPNGSDCVTASRLQMERAAHASGIIMPISKGKYTIGVLEATTGTVVTTTANAIVPVANKFAVLDKAVEDTAQNQQVTVVEDSRVVQKEAGNSPTSARKQVTKSPTKKPNREQSPGSVKQ